MLGQKWDLQCSSLTDSLTYWRSKAFGQQVAAAVVAWSETDMIGHLANLHLFDRNYPAPKGAGQWQPCRAFPLPALLPHWMHARTFIVKKNEFLAQPLPPYSTSPNSAFYSQALEIFTLNSPLSEENLWIAEFWSDDHPELTFSPAGRWLSITNQVIEMENPRIEKTLETYLKIGLALNDAIVSCWNSKYHYNMERPETYIAKVFQKDWQPIHHTPPFPSYPSGHATMGAVAAEVLTQLYGEHFEMTDHSHAGRTEFRGTPRSYHSFYEMAFESAFSRIPLGVHFRMDCEEGTRLGLEIGKKINLLELYNKQVRS